MEQGPKLFGIPEIQQCQKNRYPVLLIDRVLAVDPGKSATAIKCFSYNEWFFPAHFEGDPSVPGFVLIESLVQTFIMTFLCMDEYKGQETSFAHIDEARFRRKVVPGDTLKIEATLDSLKRGLAKGSARATVDGEPACAARFVVTLPAVFGAFVPKSAPAKE